MVSYLIAFGCCCWRRRLHETKAETPQGNRLDARRTARRVGHAPCAFQLTLIGSHCTQLFLVPCNLSFHQFIANVHSLANPSTAPRNFPDKQRSDTPPTPPRTNLPQAP